MDIVFLYFKEQCAGLLVHQLFLTGTQASVRFDIDFVYLLPSIFIWSMLDSYNYTIHFLLIDG
jgi:hypothetical protein